MGFIGCIPSGIYMFKINNRDTWTTCPNIFKETIKMPEQHHWCCSYVSMVFLISDVNFIHILHFVPL